MGEGIVREAEEAGAATPSRRAPHAEGARREDGPQGQEGLQNPQVPLREEPDQIVHGPGQATALQARGDWDVSLSTS